METLNINQGTINFWIKENTMNYSDGKLFEFFTLYPQGGSIYMRKDIDNKFKIKFIAIGKGEFNLDYDVSHFLQDTPYMVTFTWDIKSKLVLYINGNEVKTQNII